MFHKRFYFGVTFIGLLMLVLGGCAPAPIHMNDIAYLQRGYSLSQVSSSIGRTSAAQTVVTYQGTQYLVQKMRMKTGTRTVYSTFCDRHGCIPTPVFVSETAPYVFIYKKSNGYRLIDWGFLEALNKSGDPVIVKVVQLAYIKS